MKPPVFKIRLYDDACLREPAENVDSIGPGERMLITSMIETMYEAKGVGLAAPQVGIGKKIFVADIGEGVHVFVNPEIINSSGEETMEEGCLSLPDVNIPVRRAARIQIRFRDEDNTERTETFRGLLARVIQHENDHLLGKLIIDYASEDQLKTVQSKLSAIRKKNRR